MRESSSLPVSGWTSRTSDECCSVLLPHFQTLFFLSHQDRERTKHKKSMPHTQSKKRSKKKSKRSKRSKSRRSATKEKDPSQVFGDLLERAWSGTSPDLSCGPILNIIRNYVAHLRKRARTDTDGDARYILQQIQKAAPIGHRQIRDFEPGTGRGSQQFYSWARAIDRGLVTCGKHAHGVTATSLWQLLQTYHFDLIE